VSDATDPVVASSPDATTDNPCGNPHCTCGADCRCGPGCTCGTPAATAGRAAASTSTSRTCGCGDSCGCGTGCSCGSGSALRDLLAGVALGLLVPGVVGALHRRLGDDPQPDHAAHGMDHVSAGPWLGDAAWFYGAMAIVLAAGFVHALLRSRTNSCGSTPLGMGLMWGAMGAMAVGMAAGVH
jgi:hypothetical protein